jgi:hypothetical protein
MALNIHDFLWANYGPIMDSKAICKILHYPTVTALKMARSRGSLPFSPVTIEHRRGVFAMTNEIVEVLERIERERKLTAVSQKHKTEDAPA